MRLKYKVLIIALICAIVIIAAITPSTTYNIEAEVIYQSSNIVYCKDINGQHWSFTTDDYIYQEGERIVLEIYAGDMDYIQDDKVLSVKPFAE